MKTALMQPYFFPYVGYFQLIGAVDLFIVYDNIKYTKKGWINRNRILQDGEASVISLPIRGGSDALQVCERELAPDFDRQSLLNRIGSAYRRAPRFGQVFPLIEDIVRFEDRNLFCFLHNSIVRTCGHLGIGTEIRVSSQIPADHTLKGKERVLAICEAVGTSTYINPIGGLELYSREEFGRHGIDLKFLRPRPFEYEQTGKEFVPWLSIIDLMMFNSAETLADCIRGSFDLV